MGRNIKVSPEVETIIGAGQARSFRDGPFPDDFTCATCGGEGLVSEGEALTLSARLHPDNQTRLVIRHEHCGPSEVATDDRPIDGLIGDGAKLKPIMRTGIEPLAACILSPTFMVAGSDDSATEMTSLFTAKLLEDGFQPVLGNPIEELDGGEIVPGWRLRCSPTDLVITDPSGAAMYDGPAPTEIPIWIDALARQRRCLLVAGDGIELDTDFMVGLAAAVWAGRVAAGIISAEVISELPRPMKRAERRAAERAARKRKRP